MARGSGEFGVYRLEGPLGSGGTGSVFAARHALLGRRVAVKIVRASTPRVRERVMREARAQANLDHPNVVTVHDVLEEGDEVGVVMDLVEGPDLGGWLRREPRLDARLRLFGQVLAGVSAAHARGMVHRDLKPENVLVDLRGSEPLARVADFGLVTTGSDAEPRITQTGALMGTPGYMSPEQFRDAASADVRSDIFALGCVLCEVLCQVRAYPQLDLGALMTAVEREAHTDPCAFVPDLPPALARIVRDCLRVDPSHRPPSCDALAGRIAAVLATDASIDPPRVLTALAHPIPSQAHEARTRGAPTLAPSLAAESRTARRSGAAWQRLLAPLGGAALGAGVVLAAIRGVGEGSTRPDAPPMPEPSSPSVASAEVAPSPDGVPAAAPASEESSAPPPALTSGVAAASADVPAPSARVSFTGDVADAWLQAGGRRYRSGTLPPGRYVVWAVIGDSPAFEAGRVGVRAGRLTRVTCSAAFRTCRAD